MKLLSLCFLACFLFNSGFASIDTTAKRKKISGNNRIFKELNFSSLKDTLYYFGDYYIYIDLVDQMATLYSRNGESKSYKVSTGNPRIFKSIETPEGIFTVKSKIEKTYSRQFDNTPMLHWIGFSFGVGFHALYGNAYYGYLGKRTSSHGCVRVSRECAKEIYDLVKIGTPVLVHKKNNAVEIAFADSSKIYSIYPYSDFVKTANQRLKSLYEGNYFLNSSEKIAIDNNIDHKGIPIGDSSKVSNFQITLNKEYLFNINSVLDYILKYQKINKPLLLTNE